MLMAFILTTVARVARFLPAIDWICFAHCNGSFAFLSHFIPVFSGGPHSA